MKTIITAAFVLLLSSAKAQLINADSVQPETIAKALAQIAVEQNGGGASAALAKAAEYNYKAQKTAWLDNFRASGNLNEFTLTGTNVNTLNGRVLYPRYNFGVSIPFGIFANHPKQTKASYYNYQAALENVKTASQSLQLQVMTLYYNYLRTQKLYQLQEASLQDAEFATKKTEEKFSKGEVNLDVYTAATKRYSTEQSTKLSLERDLLVEKAELEILLGMPLEAALSRVRSTSRNVNSRR
jgi:outer membrane protein TolC